jgi:nitroreductase
MIKDLVVRDRTYRRFDQSFAAGMDTLRGLIDLARISGSAGNKQPLKYIFSCNPHKNASCAETISGRYRSGLIRNRNFRVFTTGIHGSFNQFFLKGGSS